MYDKEPLQNGHSQKFFFFFGRDFHSFFSAPLLDFMNCSFWADEKFHSVGSPEDEDDTQTVKQSTVNKAGASVVITRWIGEPGDGFGGLELRQLKIDAWWTSFKSTSQHGHLPANCFKAKRLTVKEIQSGAWMAHPLVRIFTIKVDWQIPWHQKLITSCTEGSRRTRRASYNWTPGYEVHAAGAMEVWGDKVSHTDMKFDL